jgi:hypothetical protein
MCFQGIIHTFLLSRWSADVFLSYQAIITTQHTPVGNWRIGVEYICTYPVESRAITIIGSLAIQKLSRLGSRWNSVILIVMIYRQGSTGMKVIWGVMGSYYVVCGATWVYHESMITIVISMCLPSIRSSRSISECPIDVLEGREEGLSQLILQ